MTLSFVISNYHIYVHKILLITKSYFGTAGKGSISEEKFVRLLNPNSLPSIKILFIAFAKVA